MLKQLAKNITKITALGYNNKKKYRINEFNNNGKIKVSTEYYNKIKSINYQQHNKGIMEGKFLGQINTFYNIGILKIMFNMLYSTG